MVEIKDMITYIDLDSYAATNKVLVNILIRYEGKELNDARLKQILCLFQLETKEGFNEEMKNKPVYIGLSMDQKSIIRFKPQNLLTNLPLANLT